MRLGDDVLAVHVLVYALTLVLAFVGAAPIAAFALRPKTKAAASGTDAAASRGRAVGALVAVVGVVLTFAAPVVLLAGVFSSFSIVPGQSDDTGILFDAVASLGALLIGPALVVSGRRARRAAPTTRVNVALALVLAFALLGASAYTMVYDAQERLLAAVVGLACVVVGKALGLALVLTGAPPTDDAGLALATQRIAGSSLLLACLLAIGAGGSWWLAGELGDRMSVRAPEGVPALEAAQRLMIWPAATCTLGLLVALVVATLAFRSPNPFPSARLSSRGDPEP